MFQLLFCFLKSEKIFIIKKKKKKDYKLSKIGSERSLGG